MKTLSKDDQQNITPTQALQLLQKGNERFTQNLSFNRNFLQQMQETIEGQFPFATVLSCIDSRTPAELIFDQGLGDIFSIRIAGNVVNEDIIGSLEFACKIAGSKLIVVLGHTHCGAIKGACDKAELGSLTQLLQKIAPAVECEDTCKDPAHRHSKNSDFVNKVAALNVRSSIDTILAKSDVLRELVEEEKINIVGGMYDLATGKVSFFA